MLKTGRACLRGHRMEMIVIQLWISLCWLLPVALELTLRRLLPDALLMRREIQAALLGGSFLCNRLLLAPAHSGYYARCHQLALESGENLAATCELVALGPGVPSSTGMRSFFREYRHPLRALKWQLRWDLLRLCGYFAAIFPGLFLFAIGAWDTSQLWQAALGGGGILLAAAGLMLMWWLLRRLTPALYRHPQDMPFYRVLSDSVRRTRRRTGAILAPYGWYFLLWPLFCCPFLPWRAAFYTEQAALCQRLRAPERKQKSAHLFHTRVLQKT